MSARIEEQKLFKLGPHVVTLLPIWFANNCAVSPGFIITGEEEILIFGFSIASTNTVKDSCFWQPNWLSTVKFKL